MYLRILGIAAIATAGLALAQSLTAQTTPASAPAPAFEVASLKPSPPTRPPVIPTQADSGRVVYNNVTPKILIQMAYKMADWGVSGGPAWLDSDRYDLVATLPPGSSADQVPLMIQSLLAERFHLETRRESKQMSVLALTVAKGGPKLKPGSTDEQWVGANMKGGIFKGGFQLHQLTMAGLAEVLAGRVGRPVVDMTHLAGAFDVSLKWTPDEISAADPAANGTSIYTAVEEQLGLKLESAKAPIEVLTVTRLEKPSEN